MNPGLRYLLVLDFEATCGDGVINREEMEIIEFPTLVYNLQEKRVQATFHEYVRPVLNPTLTEFCTALTGIIQETVDKADTFPDVWSRYKEFMRSNGFMDDPAQYSFITCGDWDLKTALPQQLSLASSDIQKSDFSLLQSHFIDRLINLKRSYKKQYNDRYTRDMNTMLKHLGMEIEGRHHSGIDDCSNILRIVERMLNDGWSPYSDLPRRSAW